MTKHDAHRLYSAGVVAGSPENVLVQPERVFEKDPTARRSVGIAVFPCGKRNGCCAGGNCAVVDEELVHVVTDSIRELGAERAVTLHIRAGRLWRLYAKMKTGAKLPLLEIDGKVYSDGVVPEKEALKRHIRSLLI